MKAVAAWKEGNQSKEFEWAAANSVKCIKSKTWQKPPWTPSLLTTPKKAMQMANNNQLIKAGNREASVTYCIINSSVFSSSEVTCWSQPRLKHIVHMHQLVLKYFWLRNCPERARGPSSPLVSEPLPSFRRRLGEQSRAFMWSLGDGAGARAAPRLLIGASTCSLVHNTFNLVAPLRIGPLPNENLIMLSVTN